MLLYDEPDEKIIKTFLDRQQRISKDKKLEVQNYGKSNIDNRAFLILDDCLYDKKWINDKSIRSIFMNGRHYKIFFLITMQHAMGLPPVLRNNVDYIFIFRNNIHKERQKIFDNYAGMFSSFEVFNQVMNQCTENYECLVIDCKTQSNKLEDQVFLYKAKEVHIKMCSTEMWNMQTLNEQRKISNSANIEEDDEEKYDAGIFMKKKNNPKINVKKSSY